MDIEKLEKKLNIIHQSTGTMFRQFLPLHNKLRAKSPAYYRWHLNPYHKQAHLGALTLCLLGVIFLAWNVLFLTPAKHSLADSQSITVSGKATFKNTNNDLDFNSSPYHSNVVIDDISKEFKGYAWNLDLGWVAFGNENNEAGPVKADPVSGKISGKAKVLSTDSFIDFNSSPHNSNVTIDVFGNFTGYAWSEDLGWLNFNGVSAVGLSLITPSSPQNIRIYDVSDRNLRDYAILVRWQAPDDFDSENFNTYLVERSEDGVNFVQQSATSSLAFYDTNVTAEQTHYYRIKSQNKTGAIEASEVVSIIPTGKYTTPPNLISGPESEVSPTAIEVKWVTDRVASSFVQIKEDGIVISEQGHTEPTTTHEVRVVGLKSQKAYSYNIRSIDVDGNVLLGEEKSFKTDNLPSIYDVDISNITLNSVIINFKSTSIANFSLYYGKTADYGQTVTEASGQQTTNHSISLSELESGTMYFFRIVGDDSDGNELRSDNSFSTLPMPEISKLEIQPVKDQPTTTLKVSWKTNVPTTSTVKYSFDGEKFMEQSSSEILTDHELTISNLADDSQYQIYATGRDQFGNPVESQRFSFDTPTDTRPPKVSDITIEASNIGNTTEQKAQVIVSWKTDEPATSQIEYGEGIGNNEYTSRTSIDSVLTNSHLVIISNLDQGKPYHLRVLSADRSSNLTIGDDNTIITGQVPRSALQVILTTLQNTFGWLSKFMGS